MGVGVCLSVCSLLRLVVSSFVGTSALTTPRGDPPEPANLVERSSTMTRAPASASPAGPARAAISATDRHSPLGQLPGHVSPQSQGRLTHRPLPPSSFPHAARAATALVWPCIMEHASGPRCYTETAFLSMPIDGMPS